MSAVELADDERAIMLAPCACGHTINDHATYVPCWRCEEENDSECSTDFETLLCQRIAEIEAERLRFLAERIAAQADGVGVALPHRVGFQLGLDHAAEWLRSEATAVTLGMRS